MSEKLKVVILTGAGISAESGIQTFRDANGLWEGHDVMQVASPEGFAQNPALVLDFYNQRRAQLHEVAPNAGHLALKDLEAHFEVAVITQNVDDLHERAGSSRVLHLHGELFKKRSSLDPENIQPCKEDILLGQTCPKGGQWRPHIVWFGEDVPMLGVAAAWAELADIFIVVGSSMQVYPAAGLIHYVPKASPKFYVDPKPAQLPHLDNLKVLAEPATTGLPALVAELIEKYG